MIASGSIRKYLFYTIGEIALLVIGILIALQINNWNEINKQKRAESRILKDLKNEINLEIDSKNEFRDYYQSRLDTLAFALDKLFSEDDIELSNSECIHIAMIHILNWEPPSISTIEELVTSGKIDLIRSEELRRKIVLFRSNSQNLEQTLNRSISELNVLVDLYPDLIIRKWDREIQWSTFECDDEAMKKNRFFLSHLQSNNGRTAEMVRLADTIIKMLEDINEIIKKEN